MRGSLARGAVAASAAMATVARPPQPHTFSVRAAASLDAHAGTAAVAAVVWHEWVPAEAAGVEAASASGSSVCARRARPAAPASSALEANYAALVVGLEACADAARSALGECDPAGVRVVASVRDATLVRQFSGEYKCKPHLKPRLEALRRAAAAFGAIELRVAPAGGAENDMQNAVKELLRVVKAAGTGIDETMGPGRSLNGGGNDVAREAAVPLKPARKRVREGEVCGMDKGRPAREGDFEAGLAVGHALTAEEEAARRASVRHRQKQHNANRLDNLRADAELLRMGLSASAAAAGRGGDGGSSGAGGFSGDASARGGGTASSRHGSYEPPPPASPRGLLISRGGALLRRVRKLVRDAARELMSMEPVEDGDEILLGKYCAMVAQAAAKGAEDALREATGAAEEAPGSADGTGGDECLEHDHQKWPAQSAPLEGAAWRLDFTGAT